MVKMKTVYLSAMLGILLYLTTMHGAPLKPVCKRWHGQCIPPIEGTKFLKKVNLDIEKLRKCKYDINSLNSLCL